MDAWMGIVIMGAPGRDLAGRFRFRFRFRF